MFFDNGSLVYKGAYTKSLSKNIELVTFWHLLYLENMIAIWKYQKLSLFTITVRSIPTIARVTRAIETTLRVGAITICMAIM